MTCSTGRGQHTRFSRRAGRQAIGWATAIALLLASPTAPARSEDAPSAKDTVASIRQQWDEGRYAMAAEMLRRPAFLTVLQLDKSALTPYLMRTSQTVHAWRYDATTPRDAAQALDAVVAAREAAQSMQSEGEDNAPALWALGLAYDMEALMRGRLADHGPSVESRGLAVEASIQARKLLAQGALGDDTMPIESLLTTARLLRSHSDLLDYGTCNAEAANLVLQKALSLAPDNTWARSERLLCLATDIRHAAGQKDMAGAKAALDLAVQIRDAIVPGQEDEATIGGWNAVVEAVRMHGVKAKDIDFVTEGVPCQHVELQVPRGMAWTGDTSPLVTVSAAETQVQWKRQAPTGGRVRFQLCAFEWDSTYSGVGGGNAKGMHKLVSELVEGCLGGAQSLSAGRSPLPRWAKSDRGVKLVGTSSAGTPVRVWVWIFKSSERQRTMLALVATDGVGFDEIPGDVVEMLRTLEERERR